MKLFHSPASPFVRKVLVLAHETGLIEQIELVRSVVSPVARDLGVVAHNPTGHIPTLLLDNGTALFDSTVISQYLDALHGGTLMHPDEPLPRARTLCLQAIADGILDAGVLMRYETVLRPEALRWPAWTEAQRTKVRSSLAALEQNWLQYLNGTLDMGVIATGCAVGYLDFRFIDDDWRADHPGLADWYGEFAKRSSMQLTWPAQVV